MVNPFEIMIILALAAGIVCIPLFADGAPQAPGPRRDR